MLEIVVDNTHHVIGILLGCLGIHTLNTSMRTKCFGAYPIPVITIKIKPSKHPSMSGKDLPRFEECLTKSLPSNGGQAIHAPGEDG